MTLCAHLKSIKTEPPTPFSILTPDCKPIAIKSRKYSQEDRIFIEKETQKLLNDGRIEISSSPWRAQPLVAIQPNGKKRLMLLIIISKSGTVSPDLDCLCPLLELPIPHDTKSLRRVIGMFAYYSKWIKQFSDKIRPLNKAETFPLPDNAISAFNELKQELANVTLMSIDENIPFVIETDASDFSISATLNEDGHPVAFHSRTLQGSELSHSSIEKEAQAIVEATEHWKHFLLGRYFTLITDQKSVSFMFDIKNHGKTKNDKILRWCLALSCYSYNIVYHPDNENNAADTLSRTCVLQLTPII